MLFINALSPFLAIVLSLAMPVYAAEVSRSSGNSAHAYYSSFGGCEDVVVGVTVNENNIKVGHGASQTISEVSVYGTISDICEFGSTSHFYGTAELQPGEFTQDGTDGATLQKSLNIDGIIVDVSITWTGRGDISGEHDQFGDDAEGLQTITNRNTSDRDATAEGTFVVNGVNRIMGDTLSGGSLGTSRSVTVSGI